MATKKIAPNQTRNTSWITKAGIVLIIVALVITQSSNASAAQPAPQQSTWSTVTKVGIGGSIGALGLGGLVCGLLTVGCPVGIAIAGGVLGAIGGTIALFPEPPAPPPVIYGPTGMPDAPEVGTGGSKGTSPGTVYDAPAVGQLERPTPGKVKVLMAPTGRSNSFAIAAKKLVRSFDWRQSAFDTASSALINKQRSGLFVGMPAASSRVILNRAPGPVHIELPPSHHPLIRPN